MNQIPPRDEEIEEVVLGSLLMNWECVPVCMPLLSEESFYNKNRPIFTAIKEDYEANGEVDFMRVEHTLKSRSDNEDTITARLTELTRHHITPDKAEDYVDMLGDLADRRKAQRGMVEQLDRIHNITARELFTNLESIIHDNLSGRDIPGLTYSQIKERDANKLSAEQLLTGDRFMDETFFRDSGCRRGEILVPFGDTGHGKTAFAVWIVSRLLDQGYRGVFCIRESKDSKIAERIYRNMKVKDNVDNLVIADTMQGLSNLGDITSVIKYHNAVKSIDFFVGDHLRIIPVEGLNEWQETERITACVNRFMYLSQEVDAFGITPSQVNRATLQNARGWQKDPNLNNLYGSSAIEQAATMAISIFRPKEHKELLDHYDNGDLRAVKGPNYNNDQSDTYDPNSVFIQQKKVREGQKYVPYVRFLHTENGLERVIPKAPF